MTRSVSDLQDMLAELEPDLFDDHSWQFVISRDGAAPPGTFAAIKEAEGLTVILPSDRAGESGPRFARITLQVRSDLEATGLTASVASALADSGIACNVVAAFHHDYLFVPWQRRGEAIAILQRLCEAARR
ncbi:ACT domain-containing protein [Erythrobacter ani]|uniref:ACT domain-containing protein n=1 Tax=Erythrobacter ani TaxID=2827235 RepID=A0ABS6SJ65_9SPHN|nr:ACT domain-containing protein [Erythrobacter ani]MBV7265048.1 ACT domain-containing protein [Erythrobacter ani]